MTSTSCARAKNVSRVVGFKMFIYQEVGNESIGIRQTWIVAEFRYATELFAICLNGCYWFSSTIVIRKEAVREAFWHSKEVSTKRWLKRFHWHIHIHIWLSMTSLKVHLLILKDFFYHQRLTLMEAAQANGSVSIVASLFIACDFFDGAIYESCWRTWRHNGKNSQFLSLVTIHFKNSEAFI